MLAKKEWFSSQNEEEKKESGSGISREIVVGINRHTKCGYLHFLSFSSLFFFLDLDTFISIDVFISFRSILSILSSLIDVIDINGIKYM
jgi:predicted glycosyltransferase involved in capsule biosynthesis